MHNVPSTGTTEYCQNMALLVLYGLCDARMVLWLNAQPPFFFFIFFFYYGGCSVESAQAVTLGFALVLIWFYHGLRLAEPV